MALNALHLAPRTQLHAPRPTPSPHAPRPTPHAPRAGDYLSILNSQVRRKPFLGGSEIAIQAIYALFIAHRNVA